MAEAVIVDQSKFEQPDLEVNSTGPIIKTTSGDSDGTDRYASDDIILSDNSNTSSQQETTHNSNHSTPSNSNSNPSPLNMQTESKSNTELSFHDLNGERGSVSLEDAPRGHEDDSQEHTDQMEDYDDLINDLINDPDNLLSQIDENEHDVEDSDDHGSMVAVLPSSPSSRDNVQIRSNGATSGFHSPSSAIQREVQREYRRMLEDESKRLKAENERLHQSLESMRRVRQSLNQRVDQMQSAVVAEQKKSEITGGSQTEEVEDEKMGREIDGNPNHDISAISPRQRREERQRERRENLARFQRARKAKEQLHLNKSRRIRQGRDRSPNMSSSNEFNKPGCNYPVRPGSRPICCRGCITNKHTTSCRERALKATDQWARHSTSTRSTNHRQHNDEDAMMRLIAAGPPHVAVPRIPVPRSPPSAPTNRYSKTPRTRSRSTSLSAFSSELQRVAPHHAASKYRRRSIATVPSLSRLRGNGNESSSRFRSRRSSHGARKVLFCDKCRCPFSSMSELKAHQSVHHSPVSAAAPSLSGMNSLSPMSGPPPPRLPPCIPELTSSFHTTMPNQTKSKFRYTKSDLSLPTPPLEVDSPTPLSGGGSGNSNAMGRADGDNEVNGHNPFSPSRNRSPLPLFHMMRSRRRRRKSPPPEPVHEHAQSTPTDDVQSGGPTNNENDRDEASPRDHGQECQESECSHCPEPHSVEQAPPTPPTPPRRPPPRRKRRQSLTQFISTLLPNGKKNNGTEPAGNDNALQSANEEEIKEEITESRVGSSSRGKRRSFGSRSLTSLLQSRLNGNSDTNTSVSSLQVEVSDIDTLTVEPSRRRIDDIKRRLQFRGKSKKEGVMNREATPEAEDEKMDIGDEDLEDFEAPHENDNENEEGHSLWDDLYAIDPQIVEQSGYDDGLPNLPLPPPSSSLDQERRHSDRRLSRSVSANTFGAGPRHRPHHRRSNAIILPFITNEGTDEHEEEEKSIQPIPRTEHDVDPYFISNEEDDAVDLDTLRRRARDRKLRRSTSFRLRRPPHRTNDGHSTDRNPFDTNRMDRRSSLSALHISDLHGRRPEAPRRRRHSSTTTVYVNSNGSRRHSVSFRSVDPSSFSASSPSARRSHRRHRSADFSGGPHSGDNLLSPPSSIWGRGAAPAQMPPPFTRGPSRPSTGSRTRTRLRQSFMSSNGGGAQRPLPDRPQEMRRRSGGGRMRLGAGGRRRPRSAMEVEHSETASNAPSTATSMQVNVNNVSRDEDIARLLQRRDSLLQHFHDTIHSSNSHSLSNSFDLNALRQRHSSRRGHHRHQSHGLGRVSADYLPVRKIQESDLGKGTESMQTCSICQEKFKIGDKVKTLPCFHFFHAHEVDKWLAHSRACPVCRHSIDQINFK